MTTLIFSNKDESYSKRAKRSLTINLVLSFVIGLIVSRFNGIVWGIAIAALIFIVQYFKSDRWDKTFITRISYTHDNIEIEFMDRQEKNNLSGPTNEFNFKKEVAFNKTGTRYLAIYQNNQLKLKQFEIADWTEQKMDEVTSALSQTNGGNL